MNILEQNTVTAAESLLRQSSAAAIFLPLADGKSLYMGTVADIASMLPDQSGAAVRGEAVAKCTLPPAGWYCTRIAGHDGPCAAYPVNSTADEHEAAILEVIDQRDKYHDMADQLAAQIAAMTEVEIGEHSSANEPWRNALIAGDEFIAAKFKAFCNGPVSARAADAPSEPSERGYPVYLTWNDQINAWVDVGLAEYLAADVQDRRVAYEPQGAAA